MSLIPNYWSECYMKKDAEVLRYMRERRKGTNQGRPSLYYARQVPTLLSQDHLCSRAIILPRRLSGCMHSLLRPRARK